MNKKFFSLLLVVTSLFSVYTLESCKDTSTDLYNQISMKHSDDYKKLTARIDDLEKALNAANSNKCDVDCYALQNEVAALKSELAALSAKFDNQPGAPADSATKEELKALGEKISTLETSVKSLIAKIDSVAKQATSITVQSVYTPAFGTVNTPFGIQSNVLVAYYGELEGVQFPGYDEDNDPIFDGEIVSNPGKVYLTVDPSNIDFSGASVSLVGNKKNAGFTLSPLAVTEDGINAGITRANGNYLYVTNSSVESVEDAQKLSLNTDKFKTAAKNLLNKEVNLSELANLVYSTIKAVNGIELNAVQLSAGDRNLVSKYDIAAVAVEPLNLTMMDAAGSVLAEKDLKGKIESVFGNMGSVSIELPEDYDGPAPTINLGRVTSAVEKILNKILPAINRLPNIANPAMFVEDGETLRLLSTDKNNPTVLDNANVKLIPSSYSLELIVPFYKKWINVTGSYLTVNGSGINSKVIDGDVMEADLSIATDKMIAIEYCVLDFAGNQKSNTYYVKVK